MFNIFKKKSEVDRLNKEYAMLMEKWHKLGKIDRKAADEVYAKAEVVANKIEGLKNT